MKFQILGVLRTGRSGQRSL